MLAFRKITLPTSLIGIAQKVFGVYALAVFCILSLLALMCVAVAPTQRHAYRAARFLAKLIFVFWGMQPSIRGLEHLQRSDPHILAANHASYLDGVLLFASLPQPHSFAIKIEIAAFAPLRFFLTRIGMRFVDRVDAHKNIAQTRRLIELSRRGVKLAFFPEGTFRREPGLLPFRLGAFRVASLAQVPIVPLVIRDSRKVLPAESWLPRYGKLEIIVLPAIAPEGNDGEAATHLKDAVRTAILREINEPAIERE